jgi:sugar lactone lactonase YvrE
VERLILLLRGSKPPLLVAHTVIGSGFGERTDPAALVVGPTGLGLDSHGTLFVADSVGNRITAIPAALIRLSSAGTGNVVTAGGALNTPLGLTIAPNGNVLTVNGGDGLLVETTPAGKQVATALLDNTGSPPGAGALFGLAVTPNANGIYYVDDAANTLNLFH